MSFKASAILASKGDSIEIELSLLSWVQVATARWGTQKNYDALPGWGARRARLDSLWSQVHSVSKVSSTGSDELDSKLRRSLFDKARYICPDSAASSVLGCDIKQDQTRPDKTKRDQAGLGQITKEIKGWNIFDPIRDIYFPLVVLNSLQSQEALQCYYLICLSMRRVQYIRQRQYVRLDINTCQQQQRLSLRLNS